MTNNLKGSLRRLTLFLLFPLLGAVAFAQDARSLAEQLLQASAVRDEAQIADLSARIEALPKPARGDRKAARPLNDEALKAFAENNFGIAASAFGRALQQDPADVEIANNYGFALLKAKQYAQAQDALLAAIAMAPKRSAAWFNLATGYGEQGDRRRSSAAFELALLYSQNKDKTKEFLEKIATDPSSAPALASAAKSVLAGPSASQPVGGQQAPASSMPAASAPVQAASGPSEPSTANAPAEAASSPARPLAVASGTQPVQAAVAPVTSTSSAAGVKLEIPSSQKGGWRDIAQMLFAVVALLQIPLTFWLIFKRTKKSKGTVSGLIYGFTASVGIMVMLVVGGMSLEGNEERAKRTAAREAEKVAEYKVRVAKELADVEVEKAKALKAQAQAAQPQAQPEKQGEGGGFGSLLSLFKGKQENNDSPVPSVSPAFAAMLDVPSCRREKRQLIFCLIKNKTTDRIKFIGLDGIYAKSYCYNKEGVQIQSIHLIGDLGANETMEYQMQCGHSDHSITRIEFRLDREDGSTPGSTARQGSASADAGLGRTKSSSNSPALASLFDVAVPQPKREDMARAFVVGEYHFSTRFPANSIALANVPSITNYKFNADGTYASSHCLGHGEVSERKFESKGGRWTIKEGRFSDSGLIYYGVWLDDIGRPSLLVDRNAGLQFNFSDTRVVMRAGTTTRCE